MSEETTTAGSAEATAPAPEPTKSADQPKAAPPPEKEASTPIVPDADDFVPTKWQPEPPDEPEEEADEETESSEAKAESSDPKPKDESEKEAPKTGKMIAVKINGEEMQVPLDKLVEKYQREESADAKFQEAAKIRKQGEALIRGLKENPLQILLNPALGHTEEGLRKMAEEFLVDKINYENMTPEQKEAYDNKRRLQEMEQRDKDRQEQEKRAEQERVQKAVTEETQKKIIDALEKSSLPKTARTVRDMAYYMYMGLQENKRRAANGMPPIVVDMDNAVKWVRQRYETDIRDLLSAMDDDTAYQVLGKDIVKKLRKKDVDAVKSANLGKTPSKQGEPATTSRKPKKITMEEFRKRNAAILEGL